MATPLTPEELRSAWSAMRHRPALRHWPQDFDQVVSDPTRARCIALEATAARRQGTREWVRREYFPARSSRWTPNPQPGSIDRKRAAAGDLDD